MVKLRHLNDYSNELLNELSDVTNHNKFEVEEAILDYNLDLFFEDDFYEFDEETKIIFLKDYCLKLVSGTYYFELWGRSELLFTLLHKSLNDSVNLNNKITEIKKLLNGKEV